MTERWFTDAQVLQVAQDLLEEDRTMADAMDLAPGKAWGDLRARWRRHSLAGVAGIEPT